MSFSAHTVFLLTFPYILFSTYIMYLNVDLYFSHPKIIDVCCSLCCGYRRKIHILYMYEPVSKNRLLGSYGQRGYCPEPFSWPWTTIFDQKWFQSFLGPKEVAQVLWSTWVHWHIENWSGTQSTTKFYQNYLKYKLWALSRHFWPKILNLAIFKPEIKVQRPTGVHGCTIEK